jgi:hypothetical protein
MPSSSPIAGNFPRILYEGIVVVSAAYASLALASWLTIVLIMSRFEEPWVARFGVAIGYLLSGAANVASGFVFGAAIGLLVARRSLRTALFTGLLIILLYALAGEGSDSSRVLVSYIFGPVSISVGLLIGTLCTRRFRHA